MYIALKPSNRRFFLPPIILYAGLSVRKKAFFKNAPTIASTGILGTYVAFAVIAVLLYSIRKAVDIKLSVRPASTALTAVLHAHGAHSTCCEPQDCLALGAIFATTDSVAVIQVLEEDRAPLLFSLVFGEGVINDATTVALLRTVQVGLQGSMAARLQTRFRAAQAFFLHCRRDWGWSPA